MHTIGKCRYSDTYMHPPTYIHTYIHSYTHTNIHSQCAGSRTIAYNKGDGFGDKAQNEKKDSALILLPSKKLVVSINSYLTASNERFKKYQEQYNTYNHSFSYIHTYIHKHIRTYIHTGI